MKKKWGQKAIMSNIRNNCSLNPFIFYYYAPYYYSIHYKVIDKIKNVLPVNSEHSTGTSTVTIPDERGNTTNDQAVSNKVRSTRITEADSARRVVV